MLPLSTFTIAGADKDRLILEALISPFPLILGRGDTKHVSCLTCNTTSLRVSTGLQTLGLDCLQYSLGHRCDVTCGNSSPRQPQLS